MKPLTLDALREAEACPDGIAWITPLLEVGGPTEADWTTRLRYWAWALANRFDVPVTPGLARLAPGTAIQYAQDRLDDDLLVVLAKLAPSAALEYAQARLGDDLLVELARRAPCTAIIYAKDRLDDDLLAELARQAPLPAQVHAPERMKRLGLVVGAQ